MALITHIKQDIQRLFSGLSKVELRERREFGNLNHPNKLALFFCIHTNDELSQIDTLARKLKPTLNKLNVFVFTENMTLKEVSANHTQLIIFSLNDFDLFGKKKNKVEQDHFSDHVDLLISFTAKADVICQRLIANINADFKIGPQSKSTAHLYDMTIANDSNTNDFSGFYDQVKHYLSILNISPELKSVKNSK